MLRDALKSNLQSMMEENQQETQELKQTYSQVIEEQNARINTLENDVKELGQKYQLTSKELEDSQKENILLREDLQKLSKKLSFHTFTL